MATTTISLIAHFGAATLDDYKFTYSPHVSARLRAFDAAMNAYSGMKVGLLTLPTEIRRMIYHQLGFSTNHRRKVQTSRYAKDELCVRASYFFTDGDGHHNQRGVQTPLAPIVKVKGISTQVMRVCKQIADETYELLYGDTNIGIGWDMATERGWYVGKRDANPPESSALPFAPEPYPTFLGTRALSHVTHITLGPLSHPDYADPLEIYIRMLDYIAFRCRKLKFLGIHLADKCQIPSESTQRLQSLIDALANIMRSCQLEKVWMGTSRYAHENLDLELAKRLISTTKYGVVDKLLATARRRRAEAQKAVLTSNESLSARIDEFHSRGASLEKTIDSDYRVKKKKQEVLGKVNALLQTYSQDADVSKLSNIPTTVLVAVQLQLSTYGALVIAQEILNTRIWLLMHLNALVVFIEKQQEIELEEAQQVMLEARLQYCLDTPAHKTTALAKLKHLHNRMSTLLPESLKLLPQRFRLDNFSELPCPITLTAPPNPSHKVTSPQLSEAERQVRFTDTRKRGIELAKSLQQAGYSPLDSMTAAEARELLAEQIEKLMSNMGFKTAPATVPVADSPKSLTKAIPVPSGAGPAR